jgi:hypothetical protein
MVFVLSCGCGSASSSSSASPEGGASSLPADIKLRDVPAADVEPFCENESAQLHAGWCLQNAILAGGAMAKTWADPASVDEARRVCQNELAGCTAPDTIANTILDCAKMFTPTNPKCSATVGDLERCNADLAAGFATQPSCSELTESSFRDVLYRMLPLSCHWPDCM